MLENFKKEMDSFLEDINKNLKDPNELNYVKERTSKLLDVMAGDIASIIKFREEKINLIVKKQREEEIKIQELKEKIDNLYEDIYEEDDSFFIDCPYCGNQFEAEIDENFQEIRCPECSNFIELDWNSNPDNDSGFTL